MKIVFWNQISSSKCRHVAKLTDHNDRYEYFLKGKVTAKTWINTNNLKEFYRPQLNGITVTDGNKPFSQFKTALLAIKEGERLRLMIKEHLNSVIKVDETCS